MATKGKTTTALPKTRAARTTKTEKTGTMSRSEAVEKILLNVEKKLAKGSLRASLGDYIKLIQLSKDMKDEARTELKVTWIEEPETTFET
jgi:hypothetical protein